MRLWLEGALCAQRIVPPNADACLAQPGRLGAFADNARSLSPALASPMTSTPQAADPLAKQLSVIEKLIAERKVHEAGQQLKAIAGVARGDARIHLLTSRLAEVSGDLQGSIEHARLAVNAAPAWSVAMTEFAMALARANQFGHALAAAERALQMDPQNPGLLTRIIDVAHRAQHHQLALDWLRRLSALTPDNRAVESLIARDLRLNGDHAAALEAYDALVAADGPQPAHLIGRLQTALALGNAERARSDGAALVAQQPDNEEFRFWNELAAGRTPPHQPATMVRALYDGFAPIYDQHVVAVLKYKLPKLVAERILQWHPDRALNVLDLGCGTGLLGVCLGKLQGALIGVDVSQPMIEQAARHNLYDRFHRVDLLEALQATPESLYEVIAALDVFIYTGDLSGALPDAHRVLKPGGRLMFSCEAAGEGEADLALRPTMRYAHRAAVVEQQCRAAGFESIEIEPMTLRYEAVQPIEGFLVTARKAG
jgi:predicted TPR repeat methyltransferase